MSKLDVEHVKRTSAGLRGTIPSELVSERPNFSDEAQALLKFHGVYQQDDRDARKSARETGAAKDYSFMLRTKNPGGFLPADFYLAVDALADTVANGTIRVTTRGALQLHGVRKENLQATIAEIDAHLGSTLGACGDINRNVMAPAQPFADPAYAAARDAARSIAELLTPRATAYYEIWQDGELVHDSQGTEREAEPIYGTTFLPRKFKIAVAAPGDNSVDIYTNDLGVVPILAPDGTLEGYDLLVGGGLGMTHGKHATFPRLADEFAFVPPHRLLDTVRAIVVVQRDNGDRTNRKHARLKYLIADRGLAWFRQAVETEAGFALEAWRPLPAWRVPEFGGWQDQGDGRFFYTVAIRSGRIRDDAGRATKRALREIVATTGCDLVATPNQNVLIVDIDPRDRPTVETILAKHGVSDTADAFERRALACPALPTCGLALAESERILPRLLGSLRDAWTNAGLAGDEPTVRVTGCPNSCARPTLAEIGIIGTSADRYHVYLGGNPQSTRLNARYRENVPLDEIASVLTPLFSAFATHRIAMESFGDFCARTTSERLAS
jgi:sulfite reductase (ferredoxin)